MKLIPSSPRFLRLGGLPLLLVGAILLFSRGAMAQTSYWNTTTGGALFTNAASWIGGVPDASMTAAFTNTVSLYALTVPANTTNANVLVGAPQSSSIKIDNSGGAWWISNALNIGTLAGQTGSFEFSTGSLVVTNATGSGQITVGGPGKGTLNFNQGNGSASVVVDRLVATNSVLSSSTNSILTLAAGKLTTLRGSTLVLATNMAAPNIGTVAGKEMAWLMLGGTNVWTYAGGNRTINFGNTAGATGTVVVAGSGTIWSNVMADANRVDLVIGANTAGFGQLVISNNAYVYTKGNLTMKGTNGLVSIASGGSLDVSANNNGSISGFGNTVLVSNQNSRFTVSTQILGSNSPSNQWIVADGATISAVSAIYVGGGSNGVGNSIQILGTNSLGTSSTFTTTGSLGIDTGTGGSGSPSAAGVGRSNFIVVANGGKLTGGASSDIWIGYYGDSPGARMLITNGGSVSVRNIQLGYGTNVAYGYLLVDGAGSVASVSQLAVGTNTFSAGAGVVNKGSGRALIQNGGTLEVTSGGGVYSGIGGAGVISNLGGVFQFLSANPAISNYGLANIVLSNGVVAFRNVGAAEVLGNITNIFYLGTNTLRLDSSTNTTLGAYTFSNGLAFSTLSLLGNSAWKSTNLFIGAGGSLLVSNANATVASPLASGVLTNLGSITVAASTVGYSQQVYVVGSYISRDSTNSFGRGLLVETGATYNLLGLSLALGSVTNKGQFSVDNGAVYRPSSGAVNPGGGTLNIGGSGWLDLTNGSFTVSGGVTNNGVISVNNANATFQNAVVVSGGYQSDPSTNTFNDNLTLLSTGYIAAASNDLYVFGKDLIIQSTNNTAFNMVQARALFASNGSGTLTHTLNLTNSSAFDYGSNILDIAHMVTNFGIGTLSLASNNTLTLTGVKSGGTTNALYVGWLDLQAIEAAGYHATNSLTALTNALVAVLSLPNINLYYDKNVAQNAYLGGLEFDLWGAGNGLLIPIPEPSSFLILGTGLTLLAFFRRKMAA